MNNPKLVELQRLVALIPEAVVIAAEVRTIFGEIERASISLENLFGGSVQAGTPSANDMAASTVRANLKSMVSAGEVRTTHLIREYRANLDAKWLDKGGPVPGEIGVRMDTVYIDNLSEICTATLQAADSFASSQ